MRPLFFLSLMLLVPVDPVADEKPIPQDSALTQKRRRDRLEWCRKTLVEGYNKIGKKDPRWDVPALLALETASKLFSREGDPATTFEDVYKPAKAAVDAGCDDPMVNYLYHRSSVGPNYPGVEEAIRRMKSCAQALATSRYSLARRAGVLELSGTYGLSAKVQDETTRKEAERDFDASLALLAESAKTEERNPFWEDLWLDTLQSLVRGYRKLGMEGPAALERVEKEMAKIPELKAMQLHLRGWFWLHFGWEARTKAFAPAVSPERFKIFEKCELEAKKALEESWKLQPGNTDVAQKLIDIDKGIGGDRATMELWFDRAMKADGDNRDACWVKLDWLDPKWHGTNTDEMLAFGRACRKTNNWRAGITLLVADAHHRVSVTLPMNTRAVYWTKPGIWDELKAVYDEYLKHYPTDNLARSKYAVCAFYCNRMIDAHTQFQLLGDNLTQGTEFPYVPMESLKRMRTEAERRYKMMNPGK